MHHCVIRENDVNYHEHNLVCGIMEIILDWTYQYNEMKMNAKDERAACVPWWV